MIPFYFGQHFHNWQIAEWGKFYGTSCLSHKYLRKGGGQNCQSHKHTYSILCEINLLKQRPLETLGALRHVCCVVNSWSGCCDSVDNVVSVDSWVGPNEAIWDGGSTARSYLRIYSTTLLLYLRLRLFQEVLINDKPSINEFKVDGMGWLGYVWQILSLFHNKQRKRIWTNWQSSNL